MADPVQEYLRREGMGRIDERVSLGGRLTVPDAGACDAELVRTPRGVFLVGATEARRGVLHDLRSGVELRPGRMRDTLRFQGQSFTIPLGGASRVRQLVALARHPRGSELLLDHTAFVEDADEVTRGALQDLLATDEIVLGLLLTDLILAVESEVLGQALDSPARLLLTNQRTALFCLTDVGDVRIDALDPATLRVAEERGRVAVTTAAFRFRSTRHNADPFRALTRALSLSGGERELEVARQGFLGRIDRKSDLSAMNLLSRLAARGDRRAGLLLSAVAIELGTRVPDLPDLGGDEPSPDDVAGLWRDFELSPETGVALVQRLRTRGAAAHALALHRVVHERLRELRDDPFHVAEADAALAEHLIAAGERSAARRLLEERLSQLPRDVENELLPPSHADLTAGSAAHHRVRLLELLAQTTSDSDSSAAIALAVLEPLVVARIDALTAVAEGELANRAARVRAVLGAGGVVASEGAIPPRPRRIADADLEGVLRHPVARAGSDILGRLQAMLAAVPVPDRGLLRDYVEPLTDRAHPAAATALRRAAALLGVPGVEGYISRGRKAVGVRSYEGAVPFVLLGGRHLDPSDAFHLTPPELCFALATEVAHLRYGHSRVTSSEVWAGALGKGKEGLDMALGMLPLLRGVRLIQQVTRVTDQVPLAAIRKTVKGAVALRRGLIEHTGKSSGDTGPDGLSTLNEQLVAAHRLMQLTADRAGLVACQDPAAALRAMLLIRTDSSPLLERIQRDGLDPVLATRDDHGVLVHQDLAIRAAQLLSFYLSDDYLRLLKAED
ncbi:MAG: hypothetical protein R3B13_37185 [Polyangiaceae bacterium]